MRILGIETSCDETAAAVVEDGVHILSSKVTSQVDLHRPYGGVVPELASRSHLETIVPVVEEALTAAQLAPDGLDAVAVTRGPGLVGALLVGFCFAKAFAHALDIPCIGVDHLQGHLHSVFLATPSPDFPFIALLASGGHTALYHVTSHTHAALLGQTVDDAAGEAFDKAAKMLGLGYPGGKAIADAAILGNPDYIRFPRPFMEDGAFHFSFSGLKTALLRYLQAHPEDMPCRMPDIAAGFQEAVTAVLTDKALRAARMAGCRRIALVGGVAANRRLRDRMRAAAADAGMAVFIPEMEWCGDNAAMIGGAGYFYLKSRGGKGDGLSSDVYSRSVGRAGLGFSV